MIDFDEKPTVWGRFRTPALILAGVVLVVGWIVFNPPSAFQSPEAEAVEPRSTTEVRTANLQESFAVDGSIVFTDSVAVRHPTSGTVTSVVAPFTDVASGDTLYTIDNVPTVALEGQIPAWRTMSVDSLGDDVLQLETALVELGYDDEGVLNVDGTFTTYTADLVELWQADLGAEETGRIEFGAVVFIGDAFQVGAVHAVVGQEVPSEGMLDLRDPNRVATFALPAADPNSLAVGDTVQALLPDRTSIDVMVVDVELSADGSWTATGDPVGLQTEGTPAESVPVEVSWDLAIGDDLVVVPASAIRRLDSGVYAVEVVRSSAESGDAPVDAVTDFVEVELGDQAGSLVEVRLGLEVGSLVIS